MVEQSENLPTEWIRHLEQSGLPFLGCLRSNCASNYVMYCDQSHRDNPPKTKPNFFQATFAMVRAHKRSASSEIRNYLLTRVFQTSIWFHWFLMKESATLTVTQCFGMEMESCDINILPRTKIPCRIIRHVHCWPILAQWGETWLCLKQYVNRIYYRMLPIDEFLKNWISSRHNLQKLC